MDAFNRIATNIINKNLSFQPCVNLRSNKTEKQYPQSYHSLKCRKKCLVVNTSCVTTLQNCVYINVVYYADNSNNNEINNNNYTFCTMPMIHWLLRAHVQKW